MNKTVFIFLGVVAVLFGSCRKDNTDEMLKAEEDRLAAFMLEHPEAAKVEGGEIYVIKTTSREEGARIAAGDYILWNLTIKKFGTDEIEYTGEKTPGIIYKDSYVDGAPELALVLDSPLDEGLKLLKEGEAADIYVPSRYHNVDFQTRVWSVEIVDVIPDLTIRQESLMYGYLREAAAAAGKRSPGIDTVRNVVSSVDNKEYNVMYYIADRGSGAPVVSASAGTATHTASAYAIRKNDMRPFDEGDITWTGTSTKTKTDPVGEILKKMNRGGKAFVAMPHILYYGNEPHRDAAEMQIVVPRWSVLFFTITVKP